MSVEQTVLSLQHPVDFVKSVYGILCHSVLDQRLLLAILVAHDL